VASDGSKGGNSLDAVTPGFTLGTLYSSGVGINKSRESLRAPSEHSPRTYLHRRDRRSHVSPVFAG